MKKAKHSAFMKVRGPIISRSQYVKTRGRLASECLKCEKQFKSEGPHNRLCPNCAYSNERSYDGLNW